MLYLENLMQILRHSIKGISIYHQLSSTRMYGIIYWYLDFFKKVIMLVKFGLKWDVRGKIICEWIHQGYVRDQHYICSRLTDGSFPTDPFHFNAKSAEIIKIITINCDNEMSEMVSETVFPDIYTGDNYSIVGFLLYWWQPLSP